MENKDDAKKGNWGASIFFIANLLNFVLATAVFTIPFPMYEVGIFLGTIILIQGELSSNPGLVFISIKKGFKSLSNNRIFSSKKFNLKKRKNNIK